MDLTLDIENYKLNVRVAGLIIQNDKILVHKNINKNHYGLLGGRISIGENSTDAIIREVKEELGKDVKVKKYLATIENFFSTTNSKFHEILFVYQIEFVNDIDKKTIFTLPNAEGKTYLKYEWLDINKIEKYNILPNCVQELLTSSIPMHKIITNY